MARTRLPADANAVARFAVAALLPSSGTAEEMTTTWDERPPSQASPRFVRIVRNASATAVAGVKRSLGLKSPSAEPRLPRAALGTNGTTPSVGAP